MSRPTNEIIRDIDAFTPTNGIWLPLDALLAELFQHPITTEGITAMLRVLERYPTEDGAGVLWSIVHGLESLPDYEPHLVASIRKTPSHLGLVMLHRIRTDAAGTSIHDIFKEVATRTDVAPSIRRDAERFLQKR